ncbi:hypothetical protein VTI28DRAFT_9355 [Corynascus sepedonium]
MQALVKMPDSTGPQGLRPVSATGPERVRLGERNVIFEETGAGLGKDLASSAQDPPGQSASTEAPDEEEPYSIRYLWGRLDLEVSQTMPDRPPHSYRAIVPWWHRGNPAVTGKDGIGASRTIELNLE